MNTAANLQDRIYLLKRSAPLLDAVVELGHPITFATDRTLALRQVFMLSQTLTFEASTLSPARIAYYFHKTIQEWQTLFQHLCQHTLRPPAVVTSNPDIDLALAVSNDERTVGLQLLKSVLLLWPPSCQWQPPNTLLPRIFVASSQIKPLLEAEALQLLIVDVVMAWSCASRTFKCYQGGGADEGAEGGGDGTNDETKRSNEDLACLHSVLGSPSVALATTATTATTSVSSWNDSMLAMKPKLQRLVHQTFTSLSTCCTFLADQSNVFDPNQMKKQKRNRLEFLNAFRALHKYGTTQIVK